MVLLSQPYMTAGKTIDLIIWTFVGRVISLLFNMLSRFVIGEGNGTPLSALAWKNPMHRGAWQATIHRVTQSWT